MSTMTIKAPLQRVARAVRFATLSGLTLATPGFLGGCRAAETDVPLPLDEWTAASEFADPPELKPNADGVHELAVAPGKATIAGNEYCLRLYNGTLPGPTLRAPVSSQKREIRVNFQNRFKTMDPRRVPDTPQGALHDFNMTNLHTHGLHVRPDRTADGQFLSDNVLHHVEQEVEEQYRFDIDEASQHEAGTFWYHAHMHGTTAIQVANGMAGALIVEGPVDSLAGIKDARSRTWLLQQIPFDAVGVTPLRPGVECNESNLSINSFSLVGRAKSTLVNGLLRPRVDVTAGQVERWRFIHGGVTQEIKVILRKASRPGTCKELDDTPIPLQQIAADGYTFPEKRQLDELVLEPGYRADVMLKAPSQEGTYCVVDAKSTQGLQGDSEAANLLAVLEVKAAEPGAPDGQTQLPSDEDLAKVARPTLDCAAPVDGTQEMIFAQQKDKDGKACEGIAGDSPLFNVNCKSYDPNHVRELILGHTDEWKLSSQRNGHPFHIHVNHFTVCPESGPAYWKDTLFVRQNEPITRAVTRYDDFTGEFVLHCHILQHEDQGMMEHEKIVDPPPVP